MKIQIPKSLANFALEQAATAQRLKDRQNLPLDIKVAMSLHRIRIWYKHWRGKVYISFSGGKDSRVLIHLIRSILPDVPAVFVDTGLEFPEIREFVKQFDNVIWVKPDMSFHQVIKTHGYPVVSKKVARMIYELSNPSEKNQLTRTLYDTGINSKGKMVKSFKIPEKWRYMVNGPFLISAKCCYYMKKKPFKKYEKETGRKTYMGTMVSDSQMRRDAYFKTGCNSYKGSNTRSAPMAFWREEDVWQYIKENDLSYSSVYDMGYQNTGCIFCAFGAHLDRGENRFQLLKKTHPKLHDYCMDKLGMREVLEFYNVKSEPVTGSSASGSSETCVFCPSCPSANCSACLLA